MALAKSSISRPILVADDDAIVRDLLRSLLTEASFTVVAAANGDEVLAFAPHIDAALAILDLAMPNRDGLQTCEALRQLPNWRDVPILMLTSHHTDEVLRAARHARVTGFMCKPFAPSELLHRIELLTGHHVGVETHTSMSWELPPPLHRDASPQASAVTWARTAAPATGSSELLQLYRSLPNDSGRVASVSRGEAIVDERRRILVAEDEDMTREIVSHVLIQDGYLVDTAVNGKQALAAVITGHYDLVLMDVRMPELSGLDATRIIRSMPNGKCDTTIVAMTANAFSTFAKEMKDAGLNGYLMKPITATSLLACVRQHLGNQGIGGAMPNTDLKRIFDLARLDNETRMFPPDAMVRFLRNLLASIEAILPCVGEGSAVGAAELRGRLHNLAGISGTLGCTALSDIAQSLESAEAHPPALRDEFVSIACATRVALQQYLAGGLPARKSPCR